MHTPASVRLHAGYPAGPVPLDRIPATAIAFLNATRSGITCKRRNEMVGEKLVAAGVITEEQLEQALAKAKESGIRVGDAVVELGFATKEQVEAALS